MFCMPWCHEVIDYTSMGRRSFSQIGAAADGQSLRGKRSGSFFGGESPESLIFEEDCIGGHTLSPPKSRRIREGVCVRGAGDERAVG